jgi:hypothetical protein
MKKKKSVKETLKIPSVFEHIEDDQERRSLKEIYDLLIFENKVPLANKLVEYIEHEEYLEEHCYNLSMRGY